jgi:hypothetical protein
MSFINTLLFASSLLQLAAAAPALSARSLSCPASNNTIYTTGSSSYSIECGIDRNAGDMPAPNGQSAATLEACIAQCQARSGCVLVDYVSGPHACYLKSAVGFTKTNSAVIGALLVTPGTSSSSVVTTASSVSKVQSIISTTATPITTATSSTAASTTTKSTSTASSTSSATGKRGLAFNKNPMTAFLGGSGSKVTWGKIQLCLLQVASSNFCLIGYNWAQTAGTGVNSAIKYIPMLWDNSAANTKNWNTVAKAAIAAGADTLLGFNEPDQSGQANMDIATAVSAWKEYMEPLVGQGAQLAAPAVTNGGAPMGLTYLENFIGNCTSCHIDVCPIHWYDSATNVAYFKAYIPQAYAACGNKPIWITEFGASGTEAEIETFLQTVLPWLDSLDYVQRYAYFYDGASTDGTYLVNAAGTAMSTIGSIFNSY